MKFIYTQHLKTRLEQRGIPIKIVKEIFTKNEEQYFDNLRDHQIVVSTVKYQDRYRKVLAAYDIIGDRIEVITIHTISQEEIRQRLTSGRYSYEKKEQN